MKSLFTIANKCKITLTDRFGNKEEKEFSNITCTVGRQNMAQRLIDNVTVNLGVAKYIAIGDGVTIAAESDVALANEVTRAEVITSLGTVTSNVAKVFARFPAGDALTITEAGVFVGPTATAVTDTGSLLCHSVFDTPIVKDSVKGLTVERTISIVNVII